MAVILVLGAGLHEGSRDLVITYGLTTLLSIRVSYICPISGILSRVICPIKSRS